jgi:hypothetical protein
VIEQSFFTGVNRVATMFLHLLAVLQATKEKISIPSTVCFITRGSCHHARAGTGRLMTAYRAQTPPFRALRRWQGIAHIYCWMRGIPESTAKKMKQQTKIN